MSNLIDSFGRDPHAASYPPSILNTSPQPPAPPALPPATPGATKGAAAPGDIFPAEPTIDKQSAGTAALLDGLGFVADPQTAWSNGEKIRLLPNPTDVSQQPHNFHWDGAAWTSGSAP